jgi:hypothetical protein
LVLTAFLAPSQGFWNWLVYRHGPCVAWCLRERILKDVISSLWNFVQATSGGGWGRGCCDTSIILDCLLKQHGMKYNSLCSEIHFFFAKACCLIF